MEATAGGSRWDVHKLGSNSLQIRAMTDKAQRRAPAGDVTLRRVVVSTFTFSRPHLKATSSAQEPLLVRAAIA